MVVGSGVTRRARALHAGILYRSLGDAIVTSSYSAPGLVLCSGSEAQRHNVANLLVGLSSRESPNVSWGNPRRRG